eukprot:CAMPEP_0194346670 /NCGR_PEP_ID=MMETSP0171-20130528/105557_1 /TAXON_ID=218684 /ORGANISM="Corethron pennatum, Strain L29A3" /LENGTH=162 /DNA_ID=CAMNT_0039113829 /DNA_START=475 /DNA_END=963 /DNA_ORIENTATION=-
MPSGVRRTRSGTTDPSTLLTNDHTGALELTPLRSADSADASDVDPPRTMNALGSTSVANAVGKGGGPAPPPAFKMSELLYSLHAFDAVARPVFATMFLAAVTTVYVQMEMSAQQEQNAMDQYSRFDTSPQRTFLDYYPLFLRGPHRTILYRTFPDELPQRGT